MSSIPYQPHIDGLRAVAVLLVVLHHLGDWAGLTGGYVGVDVFFVISGFLITGIVMSELEGGRFTFGGFYRRRIVRLAPAYFAVLIAATAAAIVWMLPAELVAFSRTAIASSVFAANIQMWREVGGYFGADANLVPLLHLWSLAVEEQFYLVWPAFLLVATTFLSRWWVGWAVVLLAFAGLLVSEWGVVKYPAAAYFLLPTRVFELAVGAALAFLPRIRLGKVLSGFAGVLGVSLILYAALGYGKQTPFPGYAALAPVLGASLLLSFAGDGPVGLALGSRIAVWIGKISYPAYLWHWPIIVFLRINEIQLTYMVGGAVLLSTFAISWATYKWIELPARRFLRESPAKVVAVGGVLPIAGTVAVAATLMVTGGLPSRYPESMNIKSEALLSLPNRDRGRCNEGSPTSPLPPDQCVLGRDGGPVEFLLVGDSHANHFAPFMDELGKDAGLRGYDMTRSNTPFLPGVDRWMMRDGKEDHHESFIPRNKYVSSLLERERYKFVVLAGNWSGFYGSEILRNGEVEGAAAFESGLRRALKVAFESSEHVIVIDVIPMLPDGLHDCSLRSERFSRPLDCSMRAALHQERVSSLDRFFDVLKREYPGVIWLQPDILMCDGMRCETEMDGIPLYRDAGHLNSMGSRLLAKKWMQRFGNPLEQSKSVPAGSEDGA